MKTPTAASPTFTLKFLAGEEVRITSRKSKNKGGEGRILEIDPSKPNQPYHVLLIRACRSKGNSFWFAERSLISLTHPPRGLFASSTVTSSDSFGLCLTPEIPAKKSTPSPVERPSILRKSSYDICVSPLLTPKVEVLRDYEEAIVLQMIEDNPRIYHAASDFVQIAKQSDIDMSSMIRLLLFVQDDISEEPWSGTA